MEKLEIKQGSFIQQTQYFIPEQESLRTGHVKIIGYQFGAKYNRGLDLGVWEILKPLKWTNISSFFLIWLKRSTAPN
jgi:hypothetical protein